MTTEDDLKAQFATMTPPPSRLTSADAVRLGRRSQRAHRFAVTGVASAGLVVAVLGAVAWAGPSTSHPSPLTASSVTCPVTVIPTEPGVSVNADTSDDPGGSHGDYGTAGGTRAIDPSGRYVVGYGDNAFVYQDGRTALIALPEGIPSGKMEPAAVNAAGIVVGNASEDVLGTSGWAWKWQSGVLTKLPMPAIPNVRNASAWGIDSRGDIVGLVETGSAEIGVVHNLTAVEWPANAPGTVKILPALGTPGGQIPSHASAISDTGYIMGWSGVGQYYWDPAGRGHKLLDAHGQASVDALVGNSAYGSALKFGANDGAARWNLATGKLTLYPGLSSINGANARGDFVAIQNQGAEVAVIGGRLVHLAMPNGFAAGVIGLMGIGNDRTVAGQIIVGAGANEPRAEVHAIDMAIWHC